MKLLRVIGTIAAWAAAMPLLVVLCVRPLRCNTIDSTIKKRTLALAEMWGAPIRASEGARLNLERLAPCLPRCTNVNRLMVAAANERILNHPEQAIAYYQQAMRYDRRPELYFNLGEAQAEAGRNQEAIQNLFTACLFNPELLPSIGNLHDEVLLRRNQYQIYIASLQKKAAP